MAIVNNSKHTDSNESIRVPQQVIDLIRRVKEIRDNAFIEVSLNNSKPRTENPDSIK